jgi:hypothetical protein
VKSDKSIAKYICMFERKKKCVNEMSYYEHTMRENKIFLDSYISCVKEKNIQKVIMSCSSKTIEYIENSKKF